MLKPTPQEIKIRTSALRCACIAAGEKTGVRKILKDAELFKSWLIGDTTDVAVQIKERYDD